MHYSLVFLVSGCATRCRHCHSDGGRGPSMALDDYRSALHALAPIVRRLEAQQHRVDISWNYEPLLHPRIVELVAMTHDLLPRQMENGSSWPTSGVPLATRSDWPDLISMLCDIGTDDLHFTVVGPAALHDMAVSRKGALEEQRIAVSRARAARIPTSVTVILAKDSLQEYDGTMGAIRDIGYDSVSVRVANYVPNDRLRQLELLRPELNDVLPFLQSIRSVPGDPEARYWDHVESFTEASIRAEILSGPERFPSFADIDAQLPQWQFLSIVPSLDVFLGNTGLYAQHLGSLRDGQGERILRGLLEGGANYEFAALYDVARLPPPAAIASGYGDGESQRLYRTKEDAMERWLDIGHLTGDLDAKITKPHECIPHFR